jgi:hypothetical protein
VPERAGMPAFRKRNAKGIGGVWVYLRLFGFVCVQKILFAFKTFYLRSTWFICAYEDFICVQQNSTKKKLLA